MTTAGNTTTIALLVLALGILGWSYYRNRDLGKFGMLSWLQSVVLMMPWLLSFGAGVEVIAPVKLRERVVGELRATAAYYE